MKCIRILTEVDPDHALHTSYSMRSCYFLNWGFMLTIIMFLTTMSSYKCAFIFVCAVDLFFQNYRVIRMKIIK